jgi:hypothetical protein
MKLNTVVNFTNTNSFTPISLLQTCKNLKCKCRKAPCLTIVQKAVLKMLGKLIPRWICLLITFFTFLGRNEDEIWISRFRRGSQAYWTVRTLATMDLLLGFDFNEPFSMQCSEKLGRFTRCNNSHFLVKRSNFI